MVNVLATWTPSVSTDVVTQHVTVSVNGVDNVFQFGPTVASYLVENLSEGDVLVFKIRVEDASGLFSPEVEATLTVPAIPPAPVTNLVLAVQ